MVYAWLIIRPPLFLGVQGYVLQLEGWLTGIMIVCRIINRRLCATLPGGTVPRRCNSTTADSLQGAFGSEADVNSLPSMQVMKIPSLKLTVRPWKQTPGKRRFLLETTIIRGYVSFREGILQNKLRSLVTIGDSHGVCMPRFPVFFNVHSYWAKSLKSLGEVSGLH